MTLGNRMKEYECASRTFLTKRMPMIIRCDGKAFHTFTRGMEKPWDENMRHCMTEAATALMNEIQGAKIAYVQSDEISVLVTDYDSLNFEPYFNKAVQKTVSISASLATMAFNRAFSYGGLGATGTACFDARCFVLPKEEVCNYFIWRQQDAVRNSIQGLGQKHFSHKQLHKKNVKDIQEMLESVHEIVWDVCATRDKRGWSVIRNQVIDVATKTNRTKFEPDWEIPLFNEDRNYIEKYVFLSETAEKLKYEEIERARDRAMWTAAFRACDGDDGICAGLSANDAMRDLFPEEAERLIADPDNSIVQNLPGSILLEE